MKPMKIWSALVALTVGGCAAPSQPAEEHTASQSQGWYYFFINYNDFDLYGRTLNGRSLNGAELTGHGVLGLSLSGVQMKGKTASVSLDGSTLHADGAVGQNFVGAKLTAILDDASTVTARIDAVQDDNGQGNDNRGPTLYTVSYETDNAWLPYCGLDAAGTPVKAVAMAGRWDYRQGVAGGGGHIDDPNAFTFACEGHAIAKCVELGYEPWRTARVCERPGDCKTITLQDVHQACTRAIRADYCGDGTSYTNDGVYIDIFDPFLIRLPSPGWPFEAEWTANGASCAVRQREPSRGVPTCWSRLQQPHCGDLSHFASGTLLMSQESP